jgi:hypothetical protein
MSKQLARLAMIAHVPVLGIVSPWLCLVAGIHSERADAIAWPLVLIGSTLGALLVMAMLIACIKNPFLSSPEKRKWELLIFLGGPITTFAYFWHEAKHGT